jgi:hypothetical protein
VTDGFAGKTGAIKAFQNGPRVMGKHASRIFMNLSDAMPLKNARNFRHIERAFKYRLNSSAGKIF